MVPAWYGSVTCTTWGSFLSSVKVASMACRSGGVGQRFRRRHREDHLGLGASGARELLVEEVEGPLGFGPRDGDRVGGRLFDADRHDGHTASTTTHPASTRRRRR